jgi:hypothetical protein
MGRKKVCLIFLIFYITLLIISASINATCISAPSQPSFATALLKNARAQVILQQFLPLVRGRVLTQQTDPADKALIPAEDVLYEEFVKYANIKCNDLKKPPAKVKETQKKASAAIRGKNKPPAPPVFLHAANGGAGGMPDLTPVIL